MTGSSHPLHTAANRSVALLVQSHPVADGAELQSLDQRAW